MLHIPKPIFSISRIQSQVSSMCDDTDENLARYWMMDSLSDFELDIWLDDKKITGFPCEVCDHLFSSEAGLKRHGKMHPPKRHGKRHQCPECSYSTDIKTHLRDHLRSHSGEKPFACPHCPKRFGRMQILRAHLLLHTGQKEHACSTCGKRYSTKGDLVKHERVHSGEKPYRCPDCGKDFTQSYDVKIHRMVHTGQRPFQCPHCEDMFLRSRDRNCHIANIHTRVFPHNCSVCGKGFNWLGELKKHGQKHHLEIRK